MRRRAWTAWGALLLGMLCGVLARVAPAAATWNLLAGVLFLTAIVLGVSLLPFWRKLVPGLVDFPDLFDAPKARERWCATCGHPTARTGPCRTCGAIHLSPRKKPQEPS